jgi:hypothetical protein
MFAVAMTPDAATAAKVDAHVQLVEQAHLPWAASIHTPTSTNAPEADVTGSTTGRRSSVCVL